MNWLRADLGPGVTAVVTTRAAGFSAEPYASLDLAEHVGDRPEHVGANRALVAEALGCAVAYLDQVHGSDVLVLRRPPEEAPAGVADAAVTATPGIALAVLVADCVPALLADAEVGVIGAAHAGRRGLAAGVLPATVAAMVALGARPERVVAYLGPAICGACYEVGAEVQAEVAAVVAGVRATTSWGTPSLDLIGGARAQLAASGVRSVHDSGVCTREDPRFFSYRRDGITGRFAGVVAVLRDTPEALHRAPSPLV